MDDRLKAIEARAMALGLHIVDYNVGDNPSLRAEFIHITDVKRGLTLFVKKTTDCLMLAERLLSLYEAGPTINVISPNLVQSDDMGKWLFTGKLRPGKYRLVKVE